MKKVISALTAAAMCASMSASVMTAFAVYTANDVEFYLKVVSASAGTVSADGTTVTFASAADAKNAKLVVQEFIKADTTNPSVQQVGSTFEASAKGIVLGTKVDDTYVGVDYSAAIGDEAEYDINGVTVKTNQFVSCFSYANKLKKFKSGVGSYQWGSSRAYTWDYDGPDQLSILWASDFADTSYDNSKETAHFASSESDKYPFTQFDATLEDLADGTYSIDIVDSWEHGTNGTQNGTFINVDGKGTGKILITNHPGIKIVIGDAGSDPATEPATDPATEPATDPATEPATDPATEPATEPATDNGNQGSSNVKDPNEMKEFTWYIDDTYYDPETDDDGFAVLTIYVSKDVGISGFQTEMKIDGKNFSDLGFSLEAIEWADGSYNFGTAQPNFAVGGMGASMNAGTEDIKLADGAAILEYYVEVPKDAKVGTVYKLTLNDTVVGHYNDTKDTPALVAGSLTIGKPGDVVPTEPATDPATEPATDPATDPATEPNTEATKDNGDVNYLYGDVNENGKVELVDVVMLNRYLTKIDKNLSAVATVNANCYREAKESDADTTTANLTGKDSVEILRFLIGLVEKLPTQG